MKILYFCQLYPPAICGGGEYIFYQFAKELARRGHKVFVITQRLKGMANYEKLSGISVYRVGPPIEYKGTLPPNLLENLGYIVSAVINGIALVLRNRIDIIHSNTYAPALAGQVCASLLGKPHIITVHDVYYIVSKDFWNKWASQASFGIFTAKLGSLIERIVLKLPANIIHTVSKTSEYDLKICGLRKVTVISNGIALSDYDSVSVKKVNPHQAIYIGRLVFHKNLHTVIKAMKKVVAKIPDAKLVVVGDGPLIFSLKKLVMSLGISENVVFKGRVAHAKKVKLLKESSFLVFPSVVEGFGIVVLEAFACCKPVLVSAVRPMTDIVQDGVDGFFIAPFDVDMWASIMYEMFSNFEKVVKMGIFGRKKIERKYTIQKSVEELEKLYTSLYIRKVR